MIETLVLERPVLDLEHLPPAGESSDQEEPVTLPDFTILSLEIRDGAVDGAPLEGAVETWRLAAVSVVGSVASGTDSRMGLESSATLDLRGPRLLDPSFRLAARLGGPLLGPWQVESASARGDGLELSGQGTVSLSTDESRVDFRVEAEPARLVELAAGASRLEAEGSVRLADKSGRLSLRGTQLPLHLLAEDATSFVADVDTSARDRGDRAPDLPASPGAARRASSRARSSAPGSTRRSTAGERGPTSGSIPAP